MEGTEKLTNGKHTNAQYTNAQHTNAQYIKTQHTNAQHTKATLKHRGTYRGGAHLKKSKISYLIVSVQFFII